MNNLGYRLDENNAAINIFVPDNGYLILKRGFAMLTVTLDKLDKEKHLKPVKVQKAAKTTKAAKGKPKKSKANVDAKIITIGDKGVGK